MEEIQIFKSTPFDKLLLFLAVVSVFFEPYLPFFNGTSTPFFVFVFIMAYVLITRFKAFERIVLSTYFIGVIVFAFVCVLMESIHSFPDYVDVYRFLNMSLGMFCISVLCRDKEAIDVALYSFIFSSAANSLYMMAGPMSALRALSAQGFNEASQARIQAFEQSSIIDFLNEISVFSGLGAILGIIALYYEPTKLKRAILIVVILLSMIGILLPSSRTGAFVFFVSLIIFLYKSKVRIKRWVIPVILFSLLLFLIVPNVVWFRIFSIGGISELREADSRVKMYTTILKIFQQYMLTGVGCGFYWKHWAVNNGLTNLTTIYEPLAPHNAFFLIWIFWGLPALVSFIFLMYLFSRALYKDITNHRQKASLYVFLFIIPVVFLFSPRFYHKAFSVGIGMVLAARYWNIFREPILPEEAEGDKIIFSPEE